MAKNLHHPTRMCVSCRQRDNQSTLFRFRCIDSELVTFEGVGRSIYLCQLCLEDEKKLSKSLMRQCRSGDKEKLMNKLKEIIADDRKS
ncbi:DUF448 domain-containing protein [Sulfurimonas aquatica]|uniref:DUF448 domain-containing protein n=1 Tax=Sulfurimonas aquatica TaxID=2672570 RepID=A0A975AZ79_9BACT|nr:DUF448 domain-containing protein [Sulfurimonas aquatica]QSZ41291.1 DUF448 domain-containing protein [Sulfurimonas aquatica]